MANKYFQDLTRGVFKENPIFVLFLGLCPTLGVTTSGLNGLAMGLATLVALLGSSFFVSLFRKVIPDEVRIPVYITIAATVVTTIDILMHAYLFELYKVLGIFIPLIVVNCVILGRAEVFASKNNMFSSSLDAIGSGIGFTLSLTVLGTIREIMGNGSIFGVTLFGEQFQPALIAILPPGAFITIALMIAGLNVIKEKKNKKKISKGESL